MLKVLHSFFLRAFSSALFANRSQIILSLYAKSEVASEVTSEVSRPHLTR